MRQLRRWLPNQRSRRINADTWLQAAKRRLHKKTNPGSMSSYFPANFITAHERTLVAAVVAVASRYIWLTEELETPRCQQSGTWGLRRSRAHAPC